MTQYHVAHLDGSYRVYRTENGIDRTYIGPRSATPREAGAWADLFASTDRISPLRDCAEAPSTEPVVPAPGSAGMGVSAQSPKGAVAGSGGTAE